MSNGSPQQQVCPGPTPAAGPTIRRTLLLAFLAVGLVPALLVATLAFWRTSAALQHEIEQGLVAQADALAADVAKLMHERLHNAATWSHVEVMQDLALGDVDKRLAMFLRRQVQDYDGLYRALAALDRHGRVVAASDAAALGRVLPTGSAPVWHEARIGSDVVTLERPSAAAGPEAGLSVRTAIQSSFGGGEIGQLLLVFDPRRLEALLDAAAGSTRLVALLDRDGQLVAASAALRERSTPLTRSLAAWMPQAPARAHVLDEAAPFAQGALIVGLGSEAATAGAAPQGLGWRVLVAVPRGEALAPVRTQAWIFAALLALAALLTLGASGWVSRAIAGPIVALTAYTRGYRRGQLPVPPPPGRGREVAELREAFVQMVGEIDEAQQKLARASALAAVGEMAAVIAHEIRTPLGIVRSSSQMLQREAELSAEGRELAGFIESETLRLNRLVTSMLDGARPRAPVFAPTDLHAIVRHCSDLLAGQAGKQGVAFELGLHAAPAELLGDAEQLTQVFLNLLLNGLQILPRGGRIAISTHVEGGQLVVGVADDGPGIAPESRTRIFEAFFFQREGGVGLGLAIVQRIVAAHGGDIEALESALGGALFRVRLPLNQPEDPAR